MLPLPSMNLNRYMSNTNHDTYMMVCNGHQSSSRTCNHPQHYPAYVVCHAMPIKWRASHRFLVPGVFRGTHCEGPHGARVRQSSQNHDQEKHSILSAHLWECPACCCCFRRPHEPPLVVPLRRRQIRVSKAVPVPSALRRLLSAPWRALPRSHFPTVAEGPTVPSARWSSRNVQDRIASVGCFHRRAWCTSGPASAIRVRMVLRAVPAGLSCANARRVAVATLVVLF